MTGRAGGPGDPTSDLAAQLRQGPPSLLLRKGTVDALNGDGTVDVKVGGADAATPGIKVLAGSITAPGDPVFLLQFGDRLQDRLVIGAPGHPGPSGLRQTVRFTSADDFEKADYPWAHSARVRVQAGGGGSGGSVTTADNTSGAGGGGGAYAERFVLLADLPASVPIVVGDGGAGAASAGSGGSQGGESKFGVLADPWGVVAEGGEGGNGNGYGGNGGNGGVGDFVIGGGAGGSVTNIPGFFSPGGHGGNSHMGGGGRGAAARASNVGGQNGERYGGGAGGPYNRNLGGIAGSDGGPGLVIVELYG